MPNSKICRERERERERVIGRFDDDAVKVSQIGWSRARGRTGHCLAVRILRDYRGIRMYDPEGDVGVGDIPSI
jgi:hypothetical protein